MLQFSIISLLFTGCGKKPGSYAVKTAADTVSTSTENATASALEKADSMWSERGNKDRLNETLALYEDALSTDSQNKHILGRLVRGWYFMGDVHESDKTAKMSAWDKAVSFGNTCLEQSESYSAGLAETNKKGEAIKTIEDTSFVPCIYWYASSLGKWAKLNGIVQSLKHKSTFVGFMERVEQLNSEYFYGAPYRYWGAYYSVLPGFAGRDLDRSKENFDKSLNIAPEYLGTYLLLADNWARNSQNVEEFDQAVQYVLASDPNVLPADLLPENQAELAKAQKLWDDRESIFPSPPPAKKLMKQPPEAAPEAPAEEAPAEEAPIEEAPAEAPTEAPTEEKSE